jgi:hypothetical protein
MPHPSKEFFLKSRGYPTLENRSAKTENKRIKDKQDLQQSPAVLVFFFLHYFVIFNSALSL